MPTSSIISVPYLLGNLLSSIAIYFRIYHKSIFYLSKLPDIIILTRHSLNVLVLSGV